MQDGLYRVDNRRGPKRYWFVAGFVMKGGKRVVCAPILRRKFNYWKRFAVRVAD